MKKYESWDTFDFSNLSDQEIKKILSKQNIPLSIKETKTVQNEFLKRPPTLAELVLFSIQLVLCFHLDLSDSCVICFLICFLII